jgi:hypothetical protein
MDYQKHHDRLIDRAKHRSINCYTEKHHIVPKCMGGLNNKENLVKLTPEEHFLVHQLLVKIYPKDQKLIYAATLMTRGHNGRRINNKFYGWLRKRFSKTHSERMKGRPKKPRTKQHTENQRRSLLEGGALIGWPKGKKRGSMSDEDKLKRSLATKGIPRPKDEQWRRSQSLVQTGKVHKKVICPHCQKEGGGGIMKRWHFDNCRTLIRSKHTKGRVIARPFFKEIQ